MNEAGEDPLELKKQGNYTKMEGKNEFLIYDFCCTTD
jgi:hypothetical protein